MRQGGRSFSRAVREVYEGVSLPPEDGDKLILNLGSGHCGRKANNVPPLNSRFNMFPAARSQNGVLRDRRPVGDWSQTFNRPVIIS